MRRKGILEWLELGTTRVKEGDAVELNDALSYLIIIHAWLYGCRGNIAHELPPFFYRQRKRNFTDEERIHKAIEIVDRLEAWAREAHAHRMVGGRGDIKQSSEEDYLKEDDDDYSDDGLADTKQSFSRSSYLSIDS